MIYRTIIEGQELRQLEDGTIIRKGKAKKGIRGNNNTGIVLDNEIFSKHILALGAIGSGKSNLMYHIVNAVLKDITEDDLVIFFDAKGDYLKEFYQEGDIVIGNSKSIPSKYDISYWNMFSDILLDDKDSINDTIREITTALFKKHIDKSQNASFLMGARDILSALMMTIIREIDNDDTAWTNKRLKELINKSDRVDIGLKINDYEDLKWAISYISEQGATSQSYLSPLYMVVQEVLAGPFAEDGDFSIRKAVQEKGGKSIFLEYDIANSNTLQPIYTLLIDLAMKEALGHRGKKGNVYFILDEFPLIPKLDYMDNALNFGRSLGVKVIAGIQNVGQVENTYTPALAKSILSGFGTNFAFKLFDEKSRKVIAERHGKNKIKESVMSTNANKGINDTVIKANVIEDWDVVKLNVGQCIVSMLNEEPFFFYPLEYISQKN